MDKNRMLKTPSMVPIYLFLIFVIFMVLFILPECSKKIDDTSNDLRKCQEALSEVLNLEKEIEELKSQLSEEKEAYDDLGDFWLEWCSDDLRMHHDRWTEYVNNSCICTEK